MEKIIVMYQFYFELTIVRDQSSFNLTIYRQNLTFFKKFCPRDYSYFED